MRKTKDDQLRRRCELLQLTNDLTMAVEVSLFDLQMLMSWWATNTVTYEDNDSQPQQGVSSIAAY